LEGCVSDGGGERTKSVTAIWSVSAVVAAIELESLKTAEPSIDVIPSGFGDDSEGVTGTSFRGGMSSAESISEGVDLPEVESSA
jgi:hypothetical protein